MFWRWCVQKAVGLQVAGDLAQPSSPQALPLACRKRSPRSRFGDIVSICRFSQKSRISFGVGLPIWTTDRVETLPKGELKSPAMKLSRGAPTAAHEFLTLNSQFLHPRLQESFLKELGGTLWAIERYFG
jgi:hypothetical protein